MAPLERLEAYFANIRRNQTERFEKDGRVLGCPFASLGSEFSTQDEAIRRMAQKSANENVFISNPL